jgi:hypothetical protein
MRMMNKKMIVFFSTVSYRDKLMKSFDTTALSFCERLVTITNLPAAVELVEKTGFRI